MKQAAARSELFGNPSSDFPRPMGAIAPRPVLVFPESTPGESYGWYRHDAQPVMRAWVQRCLNDTPVGSEHELWVAATNKASWDMGRSLREHEALLVTRVVRDMYSAHEAMRVHRLSIR